MTGLRTKKLSLCNFLFKKYVKKLKKKDEKKREKKLKEREKIKR